MGFGRMTLLGCAAVSMFGGGAAVACELGTKTSGGEAANRTAMLVHKPAKPNIVERPKVERRVPVIIAPSFPSRRIILQ